MASATARLGQAGLFGRWAERRAARRARLVRMPANDTLRLAPRGAMAVSARGGTVLVTQEHDPVDHVLTPGDQVRLAARGVVVVWALSEAAVELERAA